MKTSKFVQKKIITALELTVTFINTTNIVRVLLIENLNSLDLTINRLIANFS